MRFAIIHTWPDVNNAETECVLRLEIAAKNIGAECFIVNVDGYLIDEPSRHIRDYHVDFCLALHFANTKIHGVFTYHALWNPPQFLEDWDGPEMGCHILSFDDFVGYSSDYMLAFYNNLISPLQKTVDTTIQFVPSLPHSVAIPPRFLTNKQPKLFYSGINWERIHKDKGRHHDLFLLLDQANIMEIYGPESFMGQSPWEGFQSYQGALPFDGVSAIKAINYCGVSLVLSSDAHRAAGTVSNRLYESCAAGAVIISDDNPFVKKIMGDSVLYFTYSSDAAENVQKIKEHYNWVVANPVEAEALAKKSQAIFRDQFTLEKGLEGLCAAHAQRKQKILQLTTVAGKDQPINILIHVHLISKRKLKMVFDQVNQQSYERFHLILMAAPDFSLDYVFRDGVTISMITVHSGELISASFMAAMEKMQGDFFAFLAGGARLSEDHFGSLRKCLDVRKDAGAAYSAYFVETKTSESFLGILQKRHLYFSTLQNADSLSLDYQNLLVSPPPIHWPEGKPKEAFCYQIPCEAFLFRKSALQTLQDFPFGAWDDRNNHRYKIKLFQIEILKQQQQLAFSKIASVLILDNPEDRPLYPELVSDQVQHGVLQKRYIFDAAFQEIQQRYRNSQTVIRTEYIVMPSLYKRIKAALRRRYPFLFKVLKYIKKKSHFSLRNIITASVIIWFVCGLLLGGVLAH